MMKLILGSNSPRRAQLLTALGFEFQIRASNIDEVIPVDISVADSAQYLAQLKNEAIARNENEVVLTADTIVNLNDESLAKPANAEEAIEMLTKLSNQTHEVITGVCIRGDMTVSFSCVTEVTFKPLSLKDISYYVGNFRPFDKAGSYGIQDWIGQTGIESIHGSYYNVVGLPTHQVHKALTQEFSMMIK